MKIWAHTLAMNEERYIWYAVMSVVDHVDKVLIWDTGSDDSTVKIIKEIDKARPGKVSYREIGKVDPKEFTKASQSILSRTASDWAIIVDGDEIWWDDSIKKLTSYIRKHEKSLDAIIQPYLNIIGDIYHYQEEVAGMYRFKERKGHLNIRAFNTKIPGLHYAKEHGQRGLFDKDETPIQEKNKKKMAYLDIPYLHFTNMPRSSSRKLDLLVPKRGFKYKYELGIPFPHDYYYPEVFFRPRPSVVPSPWETRTSNYILRACIETPLKRFKRRLFRAEKSGY